MSADLFAAFADTGPEQQQSSKNEAPKPKPPAAPSFSFFDELGPAPGLQTQRLPETPHQAEDAKDDWGSFEGGSSSNPSFTKQDPFGFSSQETPLPSQTSWQPAPVYKAKANYDSNVLFDAEDAAGNDDDDDFGDFEEPESDPAPPPAPAPANGLEDLLGDLAISQPKATFNGQREDKTPRSSGPILSTSQSQVRAFAPLSHSTGPPVVASKKEDTWDSFDDWEASIPTKPQGKTITKPEPSVERPKLDAMVSPSVSLDEVQPGELPPTNVPPPSILLSLFPPLFMEAHDKLFKPMAAQTLPMRNRLLSEPATVAYLQAYLALASVAARIVAGRKMRWKRDVHLSQGMRIGPASSRATSGMKLTGIDKSENMKEEREVSDVVRAWKEQVGRLRHVVSAANQTKAGSLGPVPELQESMPVRTLKQAEGGIPAPQPCMLCGLKRDERIVGVDVAIEDSFGEFWLSQVSMHRGCRNFWQQHKDKLRQH